MGAAYLALDDARRATDFLTKAAAGKRTLSAADWLVLALAHQRLAATDDVKKACRQAAATLKPTGATLALRPLVREAIFAVGKDHPEAKELMAAAAGEIPAALNEPVDQKPDDAKGYRDRGHWHGQRGQWQAAIADYVEAFRLEPTTFDAMRLGIMLAQTGDVERLRSHSQAALARWATTENPGAADQTLKTCLLLADGKHDPMQLARLAEVAVSGDPTNDWFEWYLFAKGLHDYRTGSYADALTVCRESRRRAPATKGNPQALTALNLAIEAMALHHSGDPDGGKRTLAEAKSLLDVHIPEIDGSGWWHDWLAGHLLYREATALIDGKKN